MKLFLPLVFAVVMPAGMLFAQAPDSSISIFRYFHQNPDSLPTLRLDTNWGRLVRTKMAEEYQEAQLSFIGPDAVRDTLPVKMKARGNVRKEVCYYPPVKIKFQKADLKALNFNNMNEVKCVFPCRSGERDADYLLREALIYRLYERISPVHLHTQLVRLEGMQDGKDKLSSYALLIEHEEEFSARLNARVVERGIVNVGGLNRELYLRMVFFQYMVANTDWSLPNRHNVQMVAAEGYPRIVVVPYDFDYAGFVDAPYAIPAEVIPIKSVTDRYFLGYEVTKEEALETARFFLSKKEELLGICENYHWLSEKSRKTARDNLLDFFEILENERMIQREFVNAKG
jgi:hypothetical protein